MRYYEKCRHNKRKLKLISIVHLNTIYDLNRANLFDLTGKVAIVTGGLGISGRGFSLERSS